MLRTVAQLKDELAGMLTGTNLNNVTDLDGALSRAARVLAQNVDVPEASAKQSYMVYDGVFDYLAPPAIFGGAFTDFRPQGVTRTPNDQAYKLNIELFDQTKCYLVGGVNLTFEYDLGTPIVRIAGSRADTATVLDSMSSTDGWTAGGTASGLIVDSTVYYEQPASLRFQLSGAGTGYLEKTLENPLSMENYEDVGVAFLAIYAPDVTNLTSLELQIGSDSANYNLVTQTQGFLGAWKSGEFLLVAFDLAGAGQVGTPDFGAIQYVRASVATTGDIVNFRMGGLFICLPSPYNLYYQTAAIFNNEGTLGNEISSDNDIIVLNDAAYTLYENECCIAILLQLTGGVSNKAVQNFKDTLHGTKQEPGLYKLYRADNPSAEIREVGTWYVPRSF